MAKYFRADPYSLTVQNEADFGDLVDELFKLDLDWGARGEKGNRWGASGEDAWVVVDKKTRKANGILVGTAFHCRTVDLPVKSGAAGITALDILEDEAIGRHVSFLWDPDQRHLWFQRDRNALAVGTFIEHMSERLGRRIKHRPLFAHDAVARALKLERLKKIAVDFTPSFDAAQAAQDSPLVADLIDLRDQFGDAYIEIRVRSRRGRFLEGAATKLRNFLGKHVQQQEGAGVRKALVEGFGEHDDPDLVEPQAINLLREREEHRVKINAKRFRDPDALMAWIHRVWVQSGGGD